MNEPKLDPRFPSPYQRELAAQRRERQARFDARIPKALPPPAPEPTIQAQPPQKPPRRPKLSEKIGSEQKQMFISLPLLIRERRDLADFFVANLLRASLKWADIVGTDHHSHIVDMRRMFVNVARVRTKWSMRKLAVIFGRTEAGIHYQLRSDLELRNHRNKMRKVSRDNRAKKKMAGVAE